MPNKIKIACIGCSFTEGLEVNNQPMKHEDTYPHILHKWLSNHGHTNTMYNAGTAGSSVAFYPFMSNYLLEEFDPDVFVIQITTYDRDIFPFDPFDDDRKKMQFGWDKEFDDYYKVWDNNVNVIHLSPGFGASASEHHSEDRWSSFIKHIWEKKIKDKVAPELTYEAFKNYIATWYEQSNDSHYQSYYYYQQTYSLIDQLQSLGKKVIPFYWLNHKPKLKTKMFPVRQFPSVENLFDDATFKSLQIDNGYHFGKEGNARLVQEFLGPQVLETMK